MVYNTIVIGIDQSYNDTGISISADGQLLDVKHVCLNNYKSHSARRAVLKEKLGLLMSAVANKSENVVVIVERARIHGGNTSFINIDVILAMGSLVAVIEDVFQPHDIPIYSIDTRAWKSAVVGSCKTCENNCGVPPEKWLTVRWVIDQGFEHKILEPVDNPRKSKGTFYRNGQKYRYNDNAADSAAISMSWWSAEKNKFKKEG